MTQESGEQARDGAEKPHAPLVLAVDDDPALLELERAILERAGFRVATVSTGAAAIDAATRLEPDLVLLDIVLPDTDGYAVCQSIRELSSVPIIQVSGIMTSPSQMAEGLFGGADDYMVKPFSPASLVARVKAKLRRSGAPI